MTTIHVTRIALPAVLDGTVLDLLPPLAPAPDSAPRQRVDLDAAGLRDICPVGAARLWDTVQRATHPRLEVRLVSLPPGLARRLRHHPLLTLAGDDDGLFADPYGEATPSGR